MDIQIIKRPLGWSRKLVLNVHQDVIDLKNMFQTKDWMKWKKFWGDVYTRHGIELLRYAQYYEI